MLFIVGGMLLALVSQYGVAPRIVARQDLRLWHTVGSVLYGLQWVCALVVLLKMRLLGAVLHDSALLPSGSPDDPTGA